MKRKIKRLSKRESPCTYELISQLSDFPQVWKDLSQHYAKKGLPGLCLYKTILNPEMYCESIQYRDSKGNLLGVIDFFPVDLPCEKKGNVNILVHPKHQRKGIGMKLLKEAVKTWDINFEQQAYTPAGNQLRVAFFEWMKLSEVVLIA